MGFGGALQRTSKDGRPWVPPAWFSFIVLPAMVVASFYISQVTGWRGVASPNEEGVSWSEVSSEGLLGYSAQFLAFYYFLVLPFFLVRRYRWKKRDNRGTNE